MKAVFATAVRFIISDNGIKNIHRITLKNLEQVEIF